MLELALGLVETRGLIGALEAADAMAKSANVKLVGKVRTVPALITIKIVGETAAVRSAVEAGAAAAQRVGHLVSKHVIPRTAEGIEDIVFENTILSEKEIAELLQHTSSFVKENSITDVPVQIDDESNKDDFTEHYEPPTSSERAEYLEQINKLTVHQLRNYARGIQGLGIYGRQISKANKDELIKELLKQKFGSS